MKWEDYDPEWLAVLAEEQLAEMPWLPDALIKCKRCTAENRAYYYFVWPENANEAGADWQSDRNIMLHDRTHGGIVLDILKGKRVGGIEFLKKL